VSEVEHMLVLEGRTEGRKILLNHNTASYFRYKPWSQWSEHMTATQSGLQINSPLLAAMCSDVPTAAEEMSPESSIGCVMGTKLLTFRVPH